MILQESEVRLSELNGKIDELLKERESVLKEWCTAFSTQNPDGIVCIDENIGDNHILYLVNGESKMLVCRLDNYDMEDNIQEFYKRINTSMAIQNIANNRDAESPEYQKNLIYAKAIEIRDNYINRVMK
jgi:hypothetical protein